MALVLADRVRDTTTTTGTGTVTLSGTAPTGYQTFATAIGNANTTYYTINAGFQWEVGIGTFTTSGNTLSRTTVLSSSSAGSLVDFAAGTKDVFVTYPAEKSVNYDASGNVGIGTTAPGYKLQVAADGAGGGNQIAIAGVANANNRLYLGYDTSSNYARIQAITEGAATRPLALNPDGGNVGIGTTAPTTLLDIRGAAVGANFSAISVDNSSAGSGSPANTVSVNFSNGGAVKASITSAVYGDGYMAFATNTNVEKMRLTAAGSLGIGNTAPNTTLDVSGSITSRSGSVIADTLTNYGANLVINAAGSLPLILQTNSTERMRITPGGEILVGATSYLGAGAVKMQVGSAASAATGFLLKSTTTSLSLYASSGAGSYLSYSNGSFMAFGEAPDNLSSFTERMRLDTSGNLGLGTNGSANSRLTVIPASNITSQTGVLQTAIGEVSNATGYQLRMGYTLVGGTYRGVINALANSNATDLLLNPSGGPVGLGTTPSVWATGLGAMQMTNGALSSLNGPYGQINLTSNAYASGSADIGFTTWRYARGTIGDLGASARYTMTGAEHFWYAAAPGVAGDAISYTQRMTLDSSGNVGIGTSAPAAKLAVVDGAIVAGGVGDVLIGRNSSGFPTSGAGTGYFKLRTINDDAVSGGIVIDTLLSGALNERFRITSAGNVGIGAAAPSHRLEVSGSLCVDGFSDSTTNYISLRKGFAPSVSGGVGFTAEDHSGSSSDGLGCWGQDGIRFSTAQVERMRIDASGNLLVGTTTTILAAKFASVAGGSQNGGGFQTNGIANAYTAIACARNGNNGYVAEWWYDLNTLVGAVSVTSTATAYNTLSDYRLKDIAGPIANSGAYIDALKPVQGSWKSDGSRFIGLLAHEAQEVSETPIATGEKDGKEMQAMDYSAPEIVANLIAEVQSLRARVAQLEGK